MRATLALLSLPLLSLAACGGGGDGVNSLGTIAPPGGGGIGFGDTPSGDAPDHFLDVPAETTFDALGSFQSLTVDPQTGAQLYRGTARTAGSPSGTTTSNPRDGRLPGSHADVSPDGCRHVGIHDSATRPDFEPAFRPV